MRGTIPGAFVAAAIAAAIGAPPASGGDGEVQGRLQGRVLATGGGRVFVFDRTGKTLWQQRAGNCHDCWMLPNGNVLFADGEVKEVTPEGKIVFHFRPKEKKGGGAYACQRLENGRTLIGENSTGRILEVDRQGKVLFELQTQPTKKGSHHNLRMVRKIPNGNYLACHSGAKMVREYTPKGDIVLEIKVHTIAFSAVRLANGNTMVGYLDMVTEFDPRGKKVWEFTSKDIPGQRIGKMCGIHVQPNGNVVIGVYAAYDKQGQGLGAFEITREKKLVWAYRNPKRDRSMMGVQLLDPRGKLLRGPTVR
ncbi:MAG: beta-propeller domain-containing protein [Planctomycetota bacterium]|jgi:outer membrane protein assembly factor BamB